MIRVRPRFLKLSVVDARIKKKSGEILIKYREWDRINSQQAAASKSRADLYK